MAIIKCKECKKEVSSSAKICPHCGIKDPGVGALQMLIGFIVLAVIIAVLVSTCSEDENSTTKQTNASVKSVSDITKSVDLNWYEGGTLHSSNALEWQKASYKNKLASSADFLATTWKKNKLKPKIGSIDDLKPLAEQLVKDLDAAFKPDADAEINKQLFTNQGTASTAVMLMMLNGWLTGG